MRQISGFATFSSKGARSLPLFAFQTELREYPQTRRPKRQIRKVATSVVSIELFNSHSFYDRLTRMKIPAKTVVCTCLGLEQTRVQGIGKMR
ncbi:unnamed protein product [Protopolystoma xenopodis]|uniref:Uncharacterized protein n=1 Tax=Protopolystoma xenopodis TaxID=117903 RepID=A0A3S5BY49_9PLAT|nr:unnamed protein product [Protopolystoma xenopodis]